MSSTRQEAADSVQVGHCLCEARRIATRCARLASTSNAVDGGRQATRRVRHTLTANFGILAALRSGRQLGCNTYQWLAMYRTLLSHTNRLFSLFFFFL